MKIKINVTKEILEKSAACLSNSFKQASQNCAIALAVREIFPRAGVSDTDISTVSCNEQDYDVNADIGFMELPKSARRFIQNFDRASYYGRCTMSPISFEIDVPDSVIEKIGLDEVRRILAESKTLELVES